MKKRIEMRSLLLGSVIGIGLLFGQAIATPAAEVAPGRIIVQLKKPSVATEQDSSSASKSLEKNSRRSFVTNSGASFRAAQVASVLAAFKQDLHQQVLAARPFVTDPSVLILRMADDSNEAINAALSKLRALPQVRSAEPDQIVRVLDSNSGGTGINNDGTRTNSDGTNGASQRFVSQHLESPCWEKNWGDKNSDQTFGSESLVPALERSITRQPACSPVATDVPIPNDPDFSKTWAFQNTGQADPTGQKGTAGADINILPLWNAGITGSRKIIVAVLDTGIDLTHPDLQANIYTNPGEIPNNGIDDDHNGFVDDVHGWNFHDNNNNAQDDNDHGTHVAGIIGAIGNNAIGIAGVNWNVSLLPVKFLGSDGSGYLSGAIEAINYATIMKAQVINMSSGVGEFSQAMSDAIAAAQKAGILFVAAAGNTGVDSDTAPSYPASYALPNVVSVAATDNQDKLASFSDYGLTSVHIAAPGVDIYSTIMGGQYTTYTGTSMAAPFVSGVAALLLSQEPALSFSNVKDRLMKTSDPLPALHRKVASQGRLDAYNALHSVYPPSPDPDPSLWQDIPDDVETPHPYANDSNLDFTVQHKGVRYLRLHFQKIDTELYYDTIVVTDPTGKILEKLSGQLNDYTTDYVEGDTLNIQFTSDHTTNGYGFLIDKIQVIE